MDERKQFNVFASFWTAGKRLPDELRLQYWDALMQYGFTQTLPDGSDDLVLAVLDGMIPVIDKSFKKAANGKLGGSKPKANRKQIESKVETDKEKGERRKEKGIRSKKTKLQILYEIPIPSSLGLDFIDTWKEWLDYLNESRKLPTTTTATKQLEKLERWGPSAAKVAIDKSISSGWKGLFEPTPQELANNLEPAAEIKATLAEPVGWQEAARKYPEDVQQRIFSNGDTWEDVPNELKAYLIEDTKPLTQL